MTMTQDFEAAVDATEVWVDDLMRLLGWHDRERVYHALIAALHAYRDSLRWDEAVRVAAALPILLRGLYYEGWHPSARPAGRGRQVFLERISDGVHRDPAVDPEDVARAMFALLALRMPAADVENAKAATPLALHNLWPS